MRRRDALLGLAALAVGARRSRAAGLAGLSFESASLGRSVPVTVQLPPGYENGQARYPVLHVLHGLFESHDSWTSRGLDTILADLWSRGEVPPCVVVCVDGRNSFFLDSPLGRYQTLVTKDVIAWAESTYRVRPGRSSRALLGISMGGYAALRIALGQPDVFGAVCAHSAMLLRTIPRAEDGASRWHMNAFHAAFGDPIDAAAWAAADPLELAGRADPARVPPLRFDCGAQDRYGLAAGNAELDRRLSARGVAHEFELPPGDHGYDYVRSVLRTSLRFALGRIGA